MCKTGCSIVYECNGDNPIIKTLASLPVLHTQCEDGSWICETCYYYECCVKAGKDPSNGICGQRKCEHRPKLSNGEWTFWTYHF
jgi:hypothetical protein